MTVFANIVSAVIASLEAAPAMCDKIYRARPEEVPDQVERAVNVQWDNAIPSRGAINGAPIDWNTRMSVECFAKGMGDTGDLLVDPLLSDAYARIAQLVVDGVDFELIGLEAENTANGKKTGWVRMTYNVQHRTNNLSLN